MLEAELAAGVAEGLGAIAGAVVGHHARDGDAEAGVVGDGGLEEGDGALLLLVGQDLAEGDARGVVDADVDELPADAAALALAGAIAGDAMADALEAAELLDVDVDQLAGMLALVAAHRLGGSRSLIRLRPSRLRMRLTVAGETPVSLAICLPVQRWRRSALDLLDGRCRRRLAQPVRPRGAVVQARPGLRLEALDPLPHGPRADADGCRDGLRRLPALHTRRTNSARPCGVRRAFLCTFIRSSRRH